MPSLLSRLEGSRLAGLGLAVGLGVGAAVSVATSKHGLGSRDAADQLEVLEAERDSEATKREEAQRQVRELQEKHARLEEQLKTGAEVHASEVSSLSEAHKSELSSLTEAHKSEVVSLQENVSSLRARLGNAEAAERRVAVLEKERGQLCQEIHKGVKVAGELQDARGQAEALKQAVSDMDALLVEAMRRAEISEKEQAKMASNEQKHRSEVASLSQSLKSTRGELESARAEQEVVRRQLEGFAASEREAASLRAELNAAQIELEETAAVAAQCDVARHKARMLEAEREAMRQEIQKNARAAFELQEAREQIEVITADRDALMMQFEDVVKSLEHRQASMQKDVSATKKKRKHSLRDLSQSLSDISARLDTAESSWSPWEDINDIRQQVGTMQEAMSTVTFDDDLVRGG